MKTSPSKKNLCLFIATVLFIATGTSSAFAQAYAGQLNFLEKFAIKLYERGDRAQAAKEFERLLKIDPTNPAATEYLKKIGSEKATDKPASMSSLERISQISSDIAVLREDINGYEKESRDLAYLIRNLITENDGLYMMLHKRTRELIGLRAQFSKTPYAEQYEKLMKSMPLDRVPQRLHSPNDILSERRGQSASSVIRPSAQDDISTVTREIAAKEKELQGLRSSRNPDPKRIAELEGILKEKRALLIDKNMALIEKKGSLTQLQDELTGINTMLKGANNDYLQAIDRISAYSQSIKSEMVQKNSSQEKEFKNLLSDYADKLKELEELKQSVKSRDNSLTSYKTSLTTQDKAIGAIDENILDKDKQIAEFKTLLARYKEAVSQRDGVIQKQAAGLQFTDEQLNITNAKIGSIETLLKENDQDMAQLQSGMTKVRSFIQEKKSLPMSNAAEADGIKMRDDALDQANTIIKTLKQEIASFKETDKEHSSFLLSMNERLRDMEMNSSNKSGTIEDEKNKFTDLGTKLDKLQAQTAELTALLSQKDDIVEDLRTRLRKYEIDLLAREKEISRKDYAILNVEEKSAALEKKMLTLRLENDDLKSSASPIETSAKNTLPSTETSVLHDALAAKDKDIVELNKKLLAKNEETQRLFSMLKSSQEHLAQTPPSSREKADIAEKIEQLRTNIDRSEIELAEDRRAREAGEYKSTKTTIQDLELDVQEKNGIINDLHKSLNEKINALEEADQQIAKLQEQFSTIEIKRDAIRDVVQKRDLELAALTIAIEDRKKDLKAITEERDKLATRINDAETMAALSESKLRERNDEIMALKKEIAQIRKNLISAHERVATNDIGRNNASAEVKKLNELLAQKEAEIKELQKKLLEGAPQK